MRKLLILLFSAFLFTQATLIPNNDLPNVTVKTMDGKSLNFQTYGKTGRIVVVSFWATWCGTCKKELVKLNKLLPEWKTKYNMELVAVSVDDSKTAAKVKPYVAGQNWKCEVVLDQNSDLKRALGIANVPFSLIIKDGKIVYRHDGYVDGAEKEMEAKLKEITGK